MIISKSRLSAYFVLFLFFVFFNQSFFGSIFYGTLFYYWKQIIGISLIPLVLSTYVSKGLSDFDIFRWFLLLSLIYIFFVLLLNIGNPTYYLYRALGFVFFLSVYSIAKSLNSKDKLFLSESIYLVCIFVAAGVILDFFTGIGGFAGEKVELKAGEIRRVSFFAGSSSNLFIFLSLPLLYLRKKSALSLYASVCLFAIYLSGSRASLLFFLTFYTYLLFGLNKKFFFFTFLLFLTSIAYLFNTGFFEDNIYYLRVLSTFSVNDPGNIGRLGHYSWFVSDYFNNISNFTLFFGHGFGHLASPESAFHSKHFESSFITLFIEVGFFGVLVFYFLFFAFASSKLSGPPKFFVYLIFVHSLVVPSFLGYAIMLILGYILAINGNFKKSRF